jgi:hypothetical protein
MIRGMNVPRGRPKKVVVEGKVEQHKAMIEKMPPALREKLDVLLDWLKDDREYTLVSRWELGNELLTIEEAEETGDTKRFGKKALTKLSKFVDDDPSMLRVVTKFARCWTRKEVEHFSSALMSDGVTHLSYTHLRALANVKEEKKRKELLDATLKNCWTASQLSKEIVALHGSKSRNPKGRKPAIPKDAKSVIQQQLLFAEDFENRNLKVWKDPQHSLSKHIANMDNSEYSEQLAEQLGHLAKRMRQLAEEADKRASEAERKYEEVTDVLKIKTKPIKTAAEVTPADTSEQGTGIVAKKNGRLVLVN